LIKIPNTKHPLPAGSHVVHKNIDAVNAACSKKSLIHLLSVWHKLNNVVHLAVKHPAYFFYGLQRHIGVVLEPL
jgi:hypothetical protein